MSYHFGAFFDTHPTSPSHSHALASLLPLEVSLLFSNFYRVENCNVQYPCPPGRPQSPCFIPHLPPDTVITTVGLALSSSLLNGGLCSAYREGPFALDLYGFRTFTVRPVEFLFLSSCGVERVLRGGGLARDITSRGTYTGHGTSSGTGLDGGLDAGLLAMPQGISPRLVQLYERYRSEEDRKSVV